MIGYCPDWRKAAQGDECQERRYVEFIFNNYDNLTQLLNFRLYVLTFEDRMDQLSGVLDAIIIPGGRDIDPELYGEENTHSEFDKEDSKLRWDHQSNMILNAPKQMPILGICQGMQFLHCLSGGKMIQHLANHEEHIFKLNTFEVVPGTHLAKALAPNT